MPWHRNWGGRRPLGGSVKRDTPYGWLSGFLEYHHPLAGAYRRAGLHAYLADQAVARGEQGDLHLHRFEDHQHIASLDQVGGDFLAVEMRLARFDPALAFGVERAALLGAEGGDAFGFRGEEGLVVGQVQLAVFDAQVIAAQREVATDLQQLVRRHRVEADLVEEAQQPGLAVEGRHLAVAVPHLQGAADELITAGAFHAVHTHIGAADADGVLRGPGARRVVFGGDQAMTRVQRRGHRRAQVDVAQAHDQITGLEHRAVHLVQIRQVVDPADELQVARAPGRVLAHRGHVFLDRQLAGRVVPGQRQGG